MIHAFSLGIPLRSLAIGLLLSGAALGCAVGETETENTPSPAAAPQAAAPEQAAAPQEAAQPKAAEVVVPLAAYRPVKGASLELQPVSTWAHTEKDGFEVMTSPDGQAKILLSSFGSANVGDAIVVKKRDAALESLGATEVRFAEERQLKVGEGQLEAKANDGTCKLGSGEAGFQYAIIDDKQGHKTFLLYSFANDASAATRAAGMRVIASMRGKS